MSKDHVHLLVHFSGKPGYRYRCVKCFHDLKIVNGVVMPDEKMMSLWNGEWKQSWPWEHIPVVKAGGVA